MSDIEFKDCAYEFKLEGGDDDTGTLTGYAASFSGPDKANEIIDPHAFDACLDEFRSSGFLAHEHQWKNELGTISDVKVDDRGLQVVAKFYSTPDAQIVRKKLQEKIARGGRPGLSIGFRVLEHKREKGVRVLQRIDLVEASIVACPCNPAAQVSSVKSLDIDQEGLERAARARRQILNSRLAHHCARGVYEL